MRNSNVSKRCVNMTWDEVEEMHNEMKYNDRQMIKVGGVLVVITRIVH